MSTDRPPLIVGADKPKGHAPAFPAEAAWRVLAWFAVLFLLVGLVDLGLAFAAVDLSQPGLRFTVLAGVIGGLPLLTIGVVLFAVSALGLGSRSRLLLACLGAGLLLLLLLASLTGFLGSIDAVRTAARPADQLTITRMQWRTVLFTVAYGAVYLYAVMVTFRGFRGAGRTT